MPHPHRKTNINNEWTQSKFRLNEWSVFDFKQIYCVNLTDGKYTWRRIGQGLGSAPSPRDKLSCWVHKRRWLTLATLSDFLTHQHAWSSYAVPQPRLLRRIWSQTADRRGQQEQKLHCGWSIMGNLSLVLQHFAVIPYLLVIWLSVSRLKMSSGVGTMRFMYLTQWIPLGLNQKRT